MDNLEEIDKKVFQMWCSEGWFCYTQFYRGKAPIKFFLVNVSGEYKVRIREVVVYQGKDLNEAIAAYNSK